MIEDEAAREGYSTLWNGSDSLVAVRRRRLSLFVILALVWTQVFSIAAASRRPNVLLICVDDLKPALGCYGDPWAHSPNIDRLASTGMQFNRAYCNQAVCAPSRNALLTGVRPTSMGVYDLGTNFRKVVPDAVTLPQYFMQAGYRAEGMGKIFHVGHGNHEDPASWSVPFLPGAVIAYALPESRATNTLTREEALFANDMSRPIGMLPRGAAYESADVPDETYPDGMLAAEAIRRLRAAKEKPETPFFLAVGFVKPHLPFCAPKKYWDQYDRDQFQLASRRTAPEGAPAYAPQYGGELRQYRGIPERGPLDEDLQRTLIHGYYASMSYMDAQVGKVLNELDRLGLSDNTIVLLWGDHGYHLGDHSIWCKHTNYEEATRIPVIVRAPGITKRGTRSSALIETVDLFPTLAELAGLPLPVVPQGTDGTSLVPLLRRKLFAKTKEAVFHAYPRHPQGRELIGRAVRTDRYRLVEWKRVGAPADSADIELYDYKDDPRETRNLAKERPAMVAKMRAILEGQPEAKTQWKAAH